ncbi:MAG: MFS transporter [Nocardioides sp.]|nr:MFS transporter [Nocardioides sp.]
MTHVRDPRETRHLGAVLAVLLATGWAANHFAAIVPVLAEREGHSTALLDGVYGIYALGLLPGLIGGGALSDRLGRAWVVLPGALLAAAGTLVLLAQHDAAGLLVGRFVVGLGAGLTFGAGTAWAADIGGRSGTVLAGVFLTSGFAVGPFVSGGLAVVAPAPLTVPFAASAVLSLVAVGWAYAVAPSPAPGPLARPVGLTGGTGPGPALAWSLPVGVLVFASVTVPLLTLPPRLPAGGGGPVLVGSAALLVLGVGVAVQTLARARAFGPRAGIVGALSAAVGFGTAAAVGEQVSLLVLAVVCLALGSAYGLCLREGLLDVETLAPAERRGLMTGVFYVVTYLGFGLPLLLTTLDPLLGARAPLLVVAALAAAVATLRWVQVRRGHPAR